MGSINKTDYEYEKPVEGDSQATAPNDEKVQTLILDGAVAEDNTGNGNIGYDTSKIDTSTTESKRKSITFTETDQSTTKVYEIENPEDLGTTNEVAVHIYDSSWSTDDSIQFYMYTGSGGDGTDYSVDGVGANPYGQTGISNELAVHDPSVAEDSSPNNRTVTVNGTTQSQGQFAYAGSFDDVDDYTDVDASASDMNMGGSNPKTTVVWTQYTDAWENSEFIFDMGEQNDGEEWGLKTRNSTEGQWRAQHWVQDIDFSFGGANEWILFVMTYDGSTEKIWANATEVANQSQNLDTDDSNKFDIGTKKDNTESGGEQYDGLIDQVRNYSKNVDSAWVQAEYDSSPLGGQIFFSANAGQSAVQVSGNVTVEGSSLSGVEVLVYNKTDESFVGKTTTDSNGDWALGIGSNESDEFYVSYFYDDGSTYYASGETTNPS